jgi:hypothetical protein
VPVHVIPWEVPVRATRVPFRQRAGVAFIGNFSHAPNQDAAFWLVETIMQLVWNENPGIVCRLVGSDMPDRVRRLAGPRIRVDGEVADLAGEVFDQVRLTAAPLRYGAGVKAKVVGSFAAGLPCVMSDVAAEGILLSPQLQGLIGRDPAAIAALICRLHEDEPANRVAADAGLALLGRDFTAEATDAALQAAYAPRRTLVNRISPFSMPVRSFL